MADFFNKLKKSIDKGTAIVGAKSTTLIETNKIKQDISATTRLKNDTLMELGKTVYAMNNEGNFTMDAIQEFVTKIAEAEAKVVDLEAKIQLLQDEEKAKLDEINAQEAAAANPSAPVDVASTEVVEPAAPATPAEPVAPVEPAAPADDGEGDSGEYNG